MIKSRRYQIRLNTSNTYNLLISKNSHQNYTYDKLTKYQQLRQLRLQKYISKTKHEINEDHNKIIKNPLIPLIRSDLSLNTFNSSFYKLEDLTFTEQDDSSIGYLNINNNNTLTRKKKLFSSSPIDYSFRSSISFTTFTETCKKETNDQAIQTNIDMNEMNRIMDLIMDKKLFTKNITNNSHLGHLDTDNFMSFLVNFYFKSQKETMRIEENNESGVKVNFKMENKFENDTKAVVNVPKCPSPLTKCKQTKIFPNQFLMPQHDPLIEELKKTLEKRNQRLNRENL
ncbi:unnamed protein product [Brachionus calyciflorus]|uniref:Uncharacterized protein n=1 Tax=Brachionus calyciflorus TaxID=104777 RepID=A0A814RCC2_9BILA|nr:unnamed protein product [Brachionus calyciflorus]